MAMKAFAKTLRNFPLTVADNSDLNSAELVINLEPESK